MQQCETLEERQKSFIISINDDKFYLLQEVISNSSPTVCPNKHCLFVRVSLSMPTLPKAILIVQWGSSTSQNSSLHLLRAPAAGSILEAARIRRSPTLQRSRYPTVSSNHRSSALPPETITVKFTAADGFSFQSTAKDEERAPVVVVVVYLIIRPRDHIRQQGDSVKVKDIVEEYMWSVRRLVRNCFFFVVFWIFQFVIFGLLWCAGHRIRFLIAVPAEVKGKMVRIQRGKEECVMEWN